MAEIFEQTIHIAAPVAVVWDSLTRIERVTQWMGEPGMDLTIETDWQVGGKFVVRGSHHGRFTNRGAIVAFEPMTRLSYTHLSSLSRLPERPESYTTLCFSLSPANDATSLTLVMTGFPTLSIFKHLQFYWQGTLGILQRHAEQWRA